MSAPLRILSIGLIVALFQAGLARGDDSFLYSPDEKVERKTRAEWATAFAQWAWAIKKDQSPMTDETGKFATIGQKGPVWFLAGTAGPVRPVRSFSVPAGKPIFTPLVYGVATDYAQPLDQKAANRLKQTGNTVKDMAIILDGKKIDDLDKYRLAIGQFEIEGPKNEEEAVSPTVAGRRKVIMDGYWAVLKPLSAGEHTIQIKGRVPGDTRADPDRFVLDVTYKVKAVDQK